MLLLALVAVFALPSPTRSEDNGITIDVAIDVDTSGNGDNVLGPTESCNETPLQVGDTIDVDVVVRGIPGYDVALQRGTIIGIDLTLLFDPAVVHTIGVGLFDGPTILKAAGEADPFEWYDFNHHIGDDNEGPPGTIGASHFAMVDLSDFRESGDGVLVRITLKAVGVGTSILDLADNLGGLDFPSILQRSENIDAYPVNESGATIVVGAGDCNSPTPTPMPTLAPTMTSPPSDSPTDEATPEVQASDSPTPALTPLETIAATASKTWPPAATLDSTPTVAPVTSASSGGSSSSLKYWAIGAGALALAAAALGPIVVLRRRV
jgi:hypothetical protein